MPPFWLVITWLLLGSASAEEVASVMLVRGEATVIHGGTPGAATVGMLLSREDQLSTGFDSTLILHLHNNHLVRVDEDLALSVSDLVLLDAPPIALDAQAQLAQLLYDDERASVPRLEEAERVAGWHARLTAAVAPTGTLDFESDTIDGDLIAPDRPALDLRARESETRMEPKAEPPAEEVLDERGSFEGIGTAGTGGGGGGSSYGSAPSPIGTAVEAKPKRPRKRRGDAAAEPRSAAPEMLVDPLALRLEDPAVRQCLVDWASTLPVPVSEVTLILRLQDGKIRRVALDGGLMPPVCLREALVGVPPRVPPDVAVERRTVPVGP